ncbi:MAG: hypothetical protein AAGE59_07430 [Cyanobacteria bacterium P01_F01_bin.86]
MADQHSSTLSPQLQTVLSSLNINLEAELNRYRRNRFAEGPADNDLFADLDDAAFDIDVPEDVSASVSAAVLPMAPPPLPRNKKLFPDEPISPTASTALTVSKRDADASSMTVNSMTASPVDKASEHVAPANVPAGSVPAGSTANAALASALVRVPVEAPVKASSSDDKPAAGGAITASEASGGYLESSEKLIESLQDVPEMSEPVDTVFKPKRKTVSLLAGALLGLGALFAGLGASYLMSNPLVAQRLAGGFRRKDDAIAAASQKTFDPPGPDLSAREFIDLEIDNLSSLKMPQTTIDLASKPVASPSSTAVLPPIANQPASQLPTASSLNQSANQAIASQSISGQPATGQSLETQAVAIPAGSNYYITIPFTTEQGLIEVRQTVDEAFVRQFVDGANRIQLAAFDNAESARQFIDELKVQGITAQVYGPTAE